MTAIKAAFRAEKAGALVRLAKDVGRVGEKAGIARRAGHAEDRRRPEGRRARRAAGGIQGRPDPRDPEMLGRGALLLAAGAFNLTLWVFGALLALFGFLSSIKATTERLTDGVSAPQEGAAAAQAAGGGSEPAAGPGSGGRRRRTARVAVIATVAILIPQKWN